MPFQIPASRFTTAALSALPITGQSYDVADPAVPGLLIRVGPSGSKRWLFRFKWKKRTSRLKIGFFPEVGIAPARERELAHRKELEDGIDPRRSVRPGARRPIVTKQPMRAAAEATGPSASAISSDGEPPSIAEDPLSIEKPDPADKHSVHFLVYEFVEHYVKANREVPKEPIRILKKDVLPYWMERDPPTITSREIIERLDGIVARGARG